MDFRTLQALLTPAGQDVLQAAERLEPREVNFLADFTALSRRFPVDLSRAALEVAILRREAAAKFPFAGQMYFTRQALEQATAFPVARYRAERFKSFSAVLDLGCSVGGDTLALAQTAPVIGIELDPLRLAMAQANLQAVSHPSLSYPVNFVQADLKQLLPFRLTTELGLFFDPARRSSSGGRVFSVRQYTPPLSIVQSWLPHSPALGVKISPGVALAELSEYPAEVEFISLDGELKEAVLWFGPLRTALRRATLLRTTSGFATERHTMISEEELGSPANSSAPILLLSEPQAFIYEPDPAVLRAGLVAQLGVQLEASQLDETIAYLTASQQVATPFARSWQVETWFPFTLKTLRKALRERQVGRVTVKKRGSPLEPERLIRELRLSGEQERVVFLTHLRGRPIVILAYP